MQVSRAELESYGATIDAIGKMARSDLEQRIQALLALYSPDMPEDDWNLLRRELTRALVEVRVTWGDVVGALAAEFYDATVGADGRLPAAGVYVKTYEQQIEQVSESVRALIEHLVENQVDKFIQKMLDNAEYHVRRAAHDTTLGNAGRDRKKGVRYARVPTGIETCGFCLMLASRGFVYHSEESAGQNHHFHTHCNCRLVAARQGDTVEGYDPHGLREQWREKERQKYEKRRKSQEEQ